MQVQITFTFASNSLKYNLSWIFNSIRKMGQKIFIALCSCSLPLWLISFDTRGLLSVAYLSGIMCEEIRLAVVCISILLLSVTKIYPVDWFDILLPRIYETHKFKIKYNDISVSFAKVTGLLSKLFL